MGGSLARAGFVVCNGGYRGVMEASARGAQEAGGKTIGITAEEFPGKVNRWIDEERRVSSWQERLFRLIETGDAYVVCDGGTGTLVEFFVVWEMSNKRLVDKPVVILGQRIQDLARQVQKWPSVVNSKSVSFAETVDATVASITRLG